MSKQAMILIRDTPKIWKLSSHSMYTKEQHHSEPVIISQFICSSIFDNIFDIFDNLSTLRLCFLSLDINFEF